jgi:hypothetical protein
MTGLTSPRPPPPHTHFHPFQFPLWGETLYYLMVTFKKDSRGASSPDA